MAKSERDLEKERHWRDVLKRQAASGLNVRAFCRREEIAESAFHSWRRTIRERDGDVKPASPAPTFVPAVIAPDVASEAFTLELAGGHVLRMPGISVERLADLIAALAARGAR
jgi:transposase-like protein